MAEETREKNNRKMLAKTKPIILRADDEKLTKKDAYMLVRLLMTEPDLIDLKKDLGGLLLFFAPTMIRATTPPKTAEDYLSRFVLGEKRSQSTKKEFFEIFLRP